MLIICKLISASPVTRFPWSVEFVVARIEMICLNENDTLKIIYDFY